MLSPYEFIWIGLLIRLLRHSQGFSISAIAGESKKLLDALERASFQVSCAGSQELKAFNVPLKAEANQLRVLSPQEIKTLSDIMSTMEKMVFAEALTKSIYVLTEGRFSLDCMMNHPEKMFAASVFGRLPFLARYDFSEGFLCIAFSRPTAAAFHILRATEATLKKYYFSKIKRGRDNKPMWASMVEKLKSRRDKNVALLERLDFIRKTYRNPTSHPEETYTVETAQDLLGLCIDVVNAMGSTLTMDEEELLLS